MTERLTLAYWLKLEKERSPFLDDGEIRAIAEIKLMMAKEQHEDARTKTSEL